MRTSLIPALAASAGMVLAACSGSGVDPLETAADVQTAASAVADSSSGDAGGSGENAVAPASPQPKPVVSVVIGSAAEDRETPVPESSPTGDSTQQPDADPSTSQSTTTEPPTTRPPATPAPTTEVFTTEAPTTPAPTTEAPTTLAPTTSPPATNPPTTRPPVTQAPTTEAPTTTQASAGETRQAVLDLAKAQYGGGSFNPDSINGKPVILWFWGAY